MKPTIVISGVNLFQAGPLSIYRDALAELSRSFSDQYEIIALVHRKELFDVPGIEFVEFPKIRSSWFRRLKFEYYDLRAISKKLDAFLWLSLHDMSPSVQAKTRAVYCHNATLFSRLRWHDLLNDWRYSLFVLFYRYLYRINIHRNDFVIVQQDWMRNRFREIYGVRNIIVAHPGFAEPATFDHRVPTSFRSDGRFVFFYPAFPRVFKNMEVLLNAAKILKNDPIEIWLTFSGEESRYAQTLAAQARRLPNVTLLGKLSREQVFERYEATNCLVFPSRLETWGLPISEFKQTGKPMLVVDLPYAHETVGSHSHVYFFDPDSPKELAGWMRRASRGELPAGAVTAAAIAPPFAEGWKELFEILLRESNFSLQE